MRLQPVSCDRILRGERLAGMICAAVFLGALWLAPSDADADELDRELMAIDELRASAPAPIAEIERMGQALLDRYPDPKDQGRIYHQMAFTAAQSGIDRNPAIIARYCEKALQWHEDPVERGRIYCYLGDLHSVWKAGAPPDQQRRKAAVSYLKGLQENLAIPAPEDPVDVPSVAKGLGRDFSKDDPARQRELARHEAQRKARERAVFLNGVIEVRRVLKGQLVYIYSRSPEALEEFRMLAHDTLEDSKYIDRIEKEIAAEVAREKLRIRDRAPRAPSHRGS